MNLNNLTTAKDFINSVGFPIVISLILIYMNGKILETQNTLIYELKTTVSDTNKDVNFNRLAIQENNRLISVLIQDFEKGCKP